MADVWDSAIQDRTLVDVLVYLANCADDDGGNCYPGIRRIASKTRLSERQVTRTIARLEADGWIEILERGQGAGHLSEYRVNVTALREKRCQAVTFPRRRKKVTMGTKKGDAGTRKGDIDANPPHPLFGGSVRDPSEDSPPPLPPPRRGPLDAALDQVCAALAVANRRRRRFLRDVLELEASHGEPPGEIATRMAKQWAWQAENSHLLKRKLGMVEFFGDGYWKDANLWHWDEGLLRQRSQASVGSQR
jgi:DNA-binding MarR family transcriptional regulator